MSRFPRGLRLLCAIAFTLQACGGGGSTEPPPKPAPKPAALSNPDSTAAQLQSLNAPFRTDVFVNFGALHQHFGPAGATPVDKPGLMQGYLENSNVTPLREMVDLVVISRAYEANQKMITSIDQSMQKTLEALG